ncbi:tripartite tricarboxylate transporter TctB family protein [Nisaea acidiphila]|uniref:Tripartite tricarboxylate transporter TctB family protein n=1 Tax=Nisaea acidiphila TaxID=1862145 RepID=A0A9J7AV49_9PROT|nr:tripartite tricarboxylate transporter TctB family protein [Nisaea acidiphila]UUX51207.1 tripartite tricarboxylate transporter TctB family protein [Nisaea acidiphila]
MGRLNRDTLIALLLLVFCGVMFSASQDIEVTNYGTMPSHVWPQVVLAVLTVFSLGLLGQSVLKAEAPGAETAESAPGGIGKYRNAAIVYALFFLFLFTLDILGMLLGGVAFVFLALTLLGEPGLKRVPLHLLVAVATVGVMWSIFTFGLGVLLPDGEILQLN